MAAHLLSLFTRFLFAAPSRSQSSIQSIFSGAVGSSIYQSSILSIFSGASSVLEDILEHVVQRWDLQAAEQLPQPLRALYVAVYNITSVLRRHFRRHFSGSLALRTSWNDLYTGGILKQHTGGIWDIQAAEQLPQPLRAFCAAVYNIRHVLRKHFSGTSSGRVCSSYLMASLDYILERLHGDITSYMRRAWASAYLVGARWCRVGQTPRFEEHLCMAARTYSPAESHINLSSMIDRHLQRSSLG